MHTMTARIFLLTFALLQIVFVAGSYSSSSSSSYVVDDTTSVGSLTPNQFYKVCPGTYANKPFGQPTCGDGTPFCFYVSRPPQRKDNGQRVLIEIMGGGGCWNSYTCQKMAKYLTFPTQLDDFLGLSCTEIQAGLEMRNSGKPINMLCAEESLGDAKTDLTQYNTIIIPYCTQDVHVGNSIQEYDEADCDDYGRRDLEEVEDYYDDNDDDNNNNNNNDDGSTIRTVHHKGSHNVMSTLRWIYSNFPHATHIALTGCSAGGTAVPVVYDLIRRHYNHFGVRQVQIDSIIDSPVYLTPMYFLENVLDLWNPWPLLDRIGFNYDKYRYSEEYPTAAWDTVLQHGPNKDKWGFVSHTYDKVSQKFYWYMTGNKHYGRQRRTEDAQDNLPDQWLSELTSSVEWIEDKHKNVDSYWIDDNGHCSFGLYYALQSDGFSDWAGEIFQERTVSMAPRPALGTLCFAVLIGFLLSTGIICVSRKEFFKSEFSGSLRNVMMKQSSFAIETTDSFLVDNDVQEPRRLCASLRDIVVALLTKFSDCPVTAGLAAAITVNFWSMVITEGFTHPLNNPSLGPSAIGLSEYGINNPSLILYKHQWFRIFTSNFLCSGVLTYMIILLYLGFTVRSLEISLANPLHTLWACILVAFGNNLFYAWILEGGSCSSLALVLGLQTCHFVVKQYRGLKKHYCGPVFCMVLVFVFSFLFPFNDHWMMLVSACLVGPATGWLGFKERSIVTDGLKDSVSNEGYVGESMDQKNSFTNDVDSSKNEEVGATPIEHLTRRFTWRKEILYFYVVWLILVLSGISFTRPSELYTEPFYTGCDLYFSTEVSNVASKFYDNDGRRFLEENADRSMCAEFCVPAVASRFVQLGVDQIGITVDRGQCQDMGYTDHVADKTLSYMSYSLDVEVFYSS